MFVHSQNVNVKVRNPVEILSSPADHRLNEVHCTVKNR